jgi:hypothetical protein
MIWYKEEYFFFEPRKRKVLAHNDYRFALLSVSAVDGRHIVSINGKRDYFDTEEQAMDYAESELLKELSKRAGRKVTKETIDKPKIKIKRKHSKKPKKLTEGIRVYIYDAAGLYMQTAKNINALCDNLSIDRSKVVSQFIGDRSLLGKLGYDLYFSHIGFRTKESKTKLATRKAYLKTKKTKKDAAKK